MSAGEKVFNNTLKPSQLRMAMSLAHRCHKSLMIWGAPGIGKSQMVQQYADDMFPLVHKSKTLVEHKQQLVDAGVTSMTQGQVDAFKAKLLNQKENLVDFRLSQVEPTDLRGVPVPITFYVDSDDNFIADHLVTTGMQVHKKATTVWASPEVLTLPEDWQGVIFMDEANGAMPIVQAAAYQLFLDRRIGENVLPKGAFIVAAGNRECDGGVTFNLATPLADRMTHVELRPDLEDWIRDYAMPKLVSHNTISYLKAFVSDFNTLSPDNKNICRGSSPRSWVTVSDYEKEVDTSHTGSAEWETILNVMIEGTVGDEIANKYRAHRKMTVKLPPAMDILRGTVKDANVLPNMDVSMHYALCSNVVITMVYQHDEYKTGKLQKQDWLKYCGNFFSFLDTSYASGSNREMLMMATKSLFENKVYVNPRECPEYSAFSKKHNESLMKILK